MANRYKTFADALAAGNAPRGTPRKAENDNKPKKQPEPRYRGTLPALRWLYDNYPELAAPVAEAVQSLSSSNWDSDAVDNDQDIRPTVGELVRAARDETTGEWLPTTIEHDADGNPSVRLGTLKFVRGELVEYGETGKGRKLQPRDRTTPRIDEAKETRNPRRYVFDLRGAVASPLHASHLHRPISTAPAIVPMYDPQRGVERNREILRSFGVDGSVAFNDLPFPATKCQPAIAKGAEFLGGVARPSGNTSSGAVMWEEPASPRGEVRRVIEEVASGATLKDIGERMGFVGARVDRAARSVLVDAARVLAAANDNQRRKNAA